MLIRIYRYQDAHVDLKFEGDLSPQGFIDYRIIDQWTKTVVPQNTGWTKI